MAASMKDALIAELKDSLSEQRELNKTLQRALDNSSSQISELTVQVRILTEQLDYFKNKVFGRSSERHVPEADGQMSLFDDEPVCGLPPEDEEITVKEHKKKKPKRTLLEKLKGIETETIEVALNADEQQCPWCGTQLEVIGREIVRREVQFIPAKLKAIEYVSLHYGCPECKKAGESYITDAKVPPALIPHSYASASSVAWLICQKYSNGLPLYRQEKEWKQYGFELERGTMASWIIYCAEHYLKPLYDYCHRLLLKRSFAMADESPLQVLKEEGRTATQRSFMWMFRSGEDGIPQIILYCYAPTRNGDIARDFLKGFRGYLMVDGYTGYNKVEGIKRCCCYAHIRRYFHDAIPKKSGYDMSNPAVQGVEYCNRLFEYERSFKEKGYSFEQIKKYRNSKEKPVVEAFLSWLESQHPIGKSKLATAVNHALNRRDDMFTYMEDGRCSLSNNLSEQKMKSYVIGRKGWLFSDSVSGANASAAAYSIVEMANANGLNIYKYIEYVLSMRPSQDTPDEELEKLLPWDEHIVEMFKLEK